MGAIPETNSYLLISSKAAFLFLFFLSGWSTVVNLEPGATIGCETQCLMHMALALGEQIAPSLEGLFLLWNILRHWLACRNTASFKLCRTNRNWEFRNVEPIRCGEELDSTNRKRARRTGSQWKAGMAPSLVILHGWSCSCCLCPTPPLKLRYSQITPSEIGHDFWLFCRGNNGSWRWGGPSAGHNPPLPWALRQVLQQTDMLRNIQFPQCNVNTI